MTVPRTERIAFRMVLACGCVRFKDFEPGQDPQASKQRCRRHGKQPVEKYREGKPE